MKLAQWWTVHSLKLQLFCHDNRVSLMVIVRDHHSIRASPPSKCIFQCGVNTSSVCVRDLTSTLHKTIHCSNRKAKISRNSIALQKKQDYFAKQKLFTIIAQPPTSIFPSAPNSASNPTSFLPSDPSPCLPWSTYQPSSFPARPWVRWTYNGA
jgi:hypothetical protein